VVTFEEYKESEANTRRLTWSEGQTLCQSPQRHGARVETEWNTSRRSQRGTAARERRAVADAALRQAQKLVIVIHFALEDDSGCQVGFGENGGIASRGNILAGFFLYWKLFLFNRDMYLQWRKIE
jgi:hypothetical protein